MFEFILQNLPVIIGAILSSGGSIVAFWKWHSREVEKAFLKGKDEEKCLTRIENKADEAINNVKDVDKKLQETITKGDEHHGRMYDKLDSHAKILSEINASVSYIKGKLEK